MQLKVRFFTILVFIFSETIFADCKIDMFLKWPTTLKKYKQIKKKSDVKCWKNFSISNYKSEICSLSRGPKDSLHPVRYITLNDKKVHPKEEVIMINYQNFFRPKLSISVAALEKSLSKKIGRNIVMKWDYDHYSTSIKCGVWTINTSSNRVLSGSSKNKSKVKINELRLVKGDFYEKARKLKAKEEKKQKIKDAEYLNRDIEL
jgi:hypothetical protein